MPKDTVPIYDGFTKITSEGNSAKVTIRRPFLDALGWRRGDVVLCRVVDGALVIRPVKELIQGVSDALVIRDELAVAAAKPSAAE